jgi:hypothetical protein
MGQVDEIHHAKNQRETRRHQEKQNAKLQAIQGLHQEKTCTH